MNTTLKCGEWSCSNYKSPVNQFVDDRSWSEKSENPNGARATLKNLRCNIHAAAFKRSRYKADPIALTDEDRTRLLAEQAKVDAKERAAMEKQREENAVKNEERRRAEWAEMNLPAGHALTLDTDRGVSPQAEPVYNGQVWLGSEQPTERWDNRWLTVEPTHKFYGPVPAGKEYPYIIRVTRGSNLTPAEARELAALLFKSATKAEELNKGKAPK